MTTGTNVAVIPAGFQLPAHLQTAEAVAAIAKYNGHDAPRIDPSRIIKNGERLVIIRTVGNSANLYIPRSAA